MKSTALASRNNVRVVPATEAFMCDKTSRMKHTKKIREGKTLLEKLIYDVTRATFFLLSPKTKPFFRLLKPSPRRDVN